jgi:hypothetical protein
MAIFSIKTEETKEAKRYFKDFSEKLANPNLLKNPYIGFVKELGKGKDYILFFYLKIMWPNPKYITLLIALPLLIFVGLKPSPLYIILIPFLVGNFLFTKLFSYWAVKYTLRKGGHKPKISLMSDESLLLRLAKWDKEK